MPCFRHMGGAAGPAHVRIENSLTPITMTSTHTPIATVAGIVCSILGAVATIRFTLTLLAGSMSAVDYAPILLPLGIALLKGNRFWVWIARLHLFFLALMTSATILVFVLMSEESRGITFELHDNIGRISGGGLILVTQGLFLAAILWVYFSIFAAPARSMSRPSHP